MKTTTIPFQLNTQIANALAAVAEAVGKLSGDCTGVIVFILEQINAPLGQLSADTRSVTLTASDRLELARSTFKNTAFSREGYKIHIKNISNATASRDLQHGVENGLLQKAGGKRTTTYVFN